jgi:hypothetical protein
MAIRKPTKRQIRQLFRVHTSTQAQSERLLRSYGLDDTRTWIDENGHRLSDRIWNAREQTRTQIERVLRESLAKGEDALVTAAKLEQFLDPDLAPVRNLFGRLVRTGRNLTRAMLTHAPGRGGMGSYPARRLARTEISRAHAAATEWAAARTSFATGLKWNTSVSHPKADECDDRADADEGLGRGVYSIGSPPRMPAHPACLCFWTVEAVKDTDLVIKSLKEQYGL